MHGFVTCLTPLNLLMLVVGIVIGLLVGVLPGLTLVMGVALSLPFTYSMDVTASIILLTAMYVSGTYGGAFTSILFRIPGEPIHVPLLWDGYAMARNGEPAEGARLDAGRRAVGGLVSAVDHGAADPAGGRLRLRFSSPEYFAILLFGLASVVSLGNGSLANALISLVAGAPDRDRRHRRDLRRLPLHLRAAAARRRHRVPGRDGRGLSASARCFRASSTASRPSRSEPSRARTRSFPRFAEIGGSRACSCAARSSATSSASFPGAGATIASFVSYGVEAQFGRRRDAMGSGIAEGIVAPQAAATASVGGALVPLLALGIPGSGATAVILGAFMLHGVQPGPAGFPRPPRRWSTRSSPPSSSASC